MIGCLFACTRILKLWSISNELVNYSVLPMKIYCITEVICINNLAKFMFKNTKYYYGNKLGSVIVWVVLFLLRVLRNRIFQAQWGFELFCLHNKAFILTPQYVYVKYPCTFVARCNLDALNSE